MDAIRANLPRLNTAERKAIGLGVLTLALATIAAVGGAGLILPSLAGRIALAAGIGGSLFIAYVGGLILYPKHKKAKQRANFQNAFDVEIREAQARSYAAKADLSRYKAREETVKMGMEDVDVQAFEDYQVDASSITGTDIADDRKLSDFDSDTPLSKDGRYLKYAKKMLGKGDFPYKNHFKRLKDEYPRASVNRQRDIVHQISELTESVKGTEASLIAYEASQRAIPKREEPRKDSYADRRSREKRDLLDRLISEDRKDQTVYEYSDLCRARVRRRAQIIQLRKELEGMIY